MRDELARLDGFKRRPEATGTHIGEPLLALYHHHLERRQTKFQQVADIWCRLVPQALLDRCALEGFYRGRLTVIVDSAAHLFELRQVMLAGLEAQLLHAARGAGLRKVVLKRGSWCDQNGNPRF